jgi:hypothetical protein
VRRAGRWRTAGCRRHRLDGRQRLAQDRRRACHLDKPVKKPCRHAETAERDRRVEDRLRRHRAQRPPRPSVEVRGSMSISASPQQDHDTHPPTDFSIPFNGARPSYASLINRFVLKFRQKQGRQQLRQLRNAAVVGPTTVSGALRKASTSASVALVEELLLAGDGEHIAPGGDMVKPDLACWRKRCSASGRCRSRTAPCRDRRRRRPRGPASMKVNMLPPAVVRSSMTSTRAHLPASRLRSARCGRGPSASCGHRSSAGRAGRPGRAAKGMPAVSPPAMHVELLEAGIAA